jgi:hypothetical protein
MITFRRLRNATFIARLSKKSPSRFLEGSRKNDLTECATINDLTIMRCHEPPKNHPLTILKGFSTVSAAIETPKKRSSASLASSIALQLLIFGVS